MIYIDSRRGSVDLIPLVRDKAHGSVVVKPCPLLSTDVLFLGRGPDGAKVEVGLEYKKLPDLLACIRDGRFSGVQLDKLMAGADEHWLLVEGIWRRSPRDGVLEVLRGKSWVDTVTAGWGTTAWRHADVELWLLTMQNKVGMKLMRTDTMRRSVDFLWDLYRWWTAKEWEQHRAHLKEHENISPFTRAGQTLRMFSQLDGIGLDTAKVLKRRFRSMDGLVRARLERIATTMVGASGKKKRRLGVGRAQKIKDVLKNGD